MRAAAPHGKRSIPSREPFSSLRDMGDDMNRSSKIIPSFRRSALQIASIIGLTFALAVPALAQSPGPQAAIPPQGGTPTALQDPRYRLLARAPLPHHVVHPH